jgi:hypothetical protein
VDLLWCARRTEKECSVPMPAHLTARPHSANSIPVCAECCGSKLLQKGHSFRFVSITLPPSKAREQGGVGKSLLAPNAERNT